MDKKLVNSPDQEARLAKIRENIIEAVAYAAEHAPVIVEAISAKVEEAAAAGEFRASYSQQSPISEGIKVRHAFMVAEQQFKDVGFGTFLQTIGDIYPRDHMPQSDTDICENILELRWQGRN